MFETGNKLTEENYTEAAVWCNNNNSMIVQEEDGYYIRAIPEPSTEQLAIAKRAERNEAIYSIIWRVQRYEQQKLLDMPTTDSEQTYMDILEYIQYLRDIPNTLIFPDVEVKDFDAWLKNKVRY